jgi:hypothetical protein
LDLFETFVAPSFKGNLISVYCLNKFGFTCSFGNKLSLFHNSICVGTDFIVDKLYSLHLTSSNKEVFHVETRGTKQKIMKNLDLLWHKRLGHISKQRIQRLVSQEILIPLDFSDFEVCIECIKGKPTNVSKLGANWANDILELIHTNICGPFYTASWNGQRYCFHIHRRLLKIWLPIFNS